MPLSVKMATNIVLQISFPENSWQEISEIDVIFGEKIYIVYNNSYKGGFGKREEKTVTHVLLKAADINPCVMCEDIATILAEQLQDDEVSPEEVIEKIKEAIEKYNNLCQ